MTVTIKEIANLFNVSSETVEQIGSKQLFIISLKGKQYLISYRTIIGLVNAETNTLVLTGEKFSVTTSRHKSELLKMYANYQREIVDKDEFAAMRDKLEWMF